MVENTSQPEENPADAAAAYISGEIQKAVSEVEERLAGQLGEAIDKLSAKVDAANVQANVATAQADPNALGQSPTMPQPGFRRLRDLAASSLEQDPIKIVTEGFDIILDNVWKGVQTYLNYRAGQSNPFTTVEGLFQKYPDMRKIYSQDPFGAQASQMYAQFHVGGYNSAIKAMRATGQIPPEASGGGGIPPDPFPQPSGRANGSVGGSSGRNGTQPTGVGSSVAPMQGAYEQANGGSPQLRIQDVL